MFCEDCSELLCPMCALMKHRQCSKLNSVTPTAAARRLHLETSQRNLISTLGKAKEKQAKLKEEKEALSANITCNLREMDEAYDSLITKVKEQKRNDMLRTHEAIAKAQKHLASCEEQIGVFIAVLEDTVSKTQSRQLITSDIQLLQEVSHQELKEAEEDVVAATAFLTKVDSSRFDVPGVAKETLAEVKQLIGKMSLTTCPAETPQGTRALHPTTAASSKPAGPEHSPAKLSAVGNGISHGHPCFALQLQQERLACRSVLSTSSDISAASTSSSEGSMPYGNNSDGQRNPFSFFSMGKRSVRRPTARPRNSLARRALSGASVFSVKHPVVTAANSTVKQASPTRSSANPGFVFVPAKNVTALFSHFKPIPKLAASDPASDDTLLDIMPSTSAMSGAHTLPKSVLPKPAGAEADLMLLSSRGTNTQHSNGLASALVRPPIKTVKTAEQAKKAASNSLSITSSSTMTSPNTTNNAGQGSAQSSKAAEIPQNASHSGTPDGATGSVEGATAPLGRLSLLAEEPMIAGAESDSKPVADELQKPDSQKLRCSFKICPSSAGDLRRPIISDFAVLPNGRLVVVDRANSRVKVVLLMREGQDGLCPSVDLTKPHGVCHMNGDMIAVVSHVAKTLQLVMVNSHQLSLQHIHNTCRGYLNIARLSPSVLAARFSLGVHILDVGGPALRLKVAIVHDKNGKPLFQAPNSMCTTQDGKIVILDSMTLEVSCWDQSGAALWRVSHAGPSFPRSVCSVGLRRLYVISSSQQLYGLDCLNAASGKLLHSVKLDATSLKEVSTVAQDEQDRILINNLEEVVCFDWI